MPRTRLAWYQQIAVNGMVSTSFDHNFNQPDSRTNGYRVFDSKGATSSWMSRNWPSRKRRAPGDAGFKHPPHGRIGDSFGRRLGRHVP